MKLALIGVGLIGGSLARALRAAGHADRIVGFDIDAQALTRAVEMRVIDESAASAARVVDGADVVVVSTPVGSMQNIFREIAPHLSDTVIVTDTGSTKSSVIDAAQRELGAAFERFVPGHPIAGSERSGVQHAQTALFSNRVFISTPIAQTSESALSRIEGTWQVVGCRLQRMTPTEHDDVFAAVSHLPHLLAFTLVAQIADQPDAARKLAMAGSGFRDFTRIAASDPAMWADICLANRQSLTRELAAYKALLNHLNRALENADVAALRHILERGAAARRACDVSLDDEDGLMRPD